METVPAILPGAVFFSPCPFIRSRGGQIRGTGA